MAGDAGKKDAPRKERTAGLKSSEAGSRGGGIDLNTDPDPSIELDDSPSRQAVKTTRTPRARIPSGFPVGNRNRSRAGAEPTSRTRKPPTLKGAPPMSYYHLKPGTTRILYRLNPRFGKDFTHTVGPLYAADPDPLEPWIPFRGGGGSRAGPAYKRSNWSTEDKDSLAEVMADLHGVPLSMRVWKAASAALDRSPDSCRNYYRDHTTDMDERIAKALELKEKEKEKQQRYHREEEEEEEEEEQPREEHHHRREESVASAQAGKQPIIEGISEGD